jgi:hypothetical protein
VRLDLGFIPSGPLGDVAGASGFVFAGSPVLLGEVPGRCGGAGELEDGTGSLDPVDGAHVVCLRSSARFPLGMYPRFLRVFDKEGTWTPNSLDRDRRVSPSACRAARIARVSSSSKDASTRTSWRERIMA